MKKPHILVIDDEPGICQGLQEFLQESGYRVWVAATAEEGLSLIEQNAPQAILLDIRLPGMSGIEAVPQFKKKLPHIPILLMTAYGTIQTAVEALKHGVFDYLIKPIDLDQVFILLEKIFQKKSPTSTNDAPQANLFADSSIVGQSFKMQQVFKQIAYAVSCETNVLIQGESGTGKELVARAIHDYGTRRNGPYSIVNCAALAETIFESELYGHEAGAYTGATKARAGKVEMAEGGTLFLDEIGEVPLEQQSKLLRFLESKTFERVGSNLSKKVDARIISATNQDLQKCVENETFRRDLFYRLNALVIVLPPLRERTEDIPLLTQHFLQQMNKKEYALEEDALLLLKQYPWPGNIREFKNIIEQAALIAGNLPISLRHLPLYLRSKTMDSSTKEIDSLVQKMYQKISQQNVENCFEAVLAQFEAALIRHVLEECQGNQSLVARKLGLHRTTLRNKIKLYQC